MSLILLAGLGNPGAKYDQTRHNAGFWLLDILANRYHADWRTESKLHGLATQISMGDNRLILLKPTTYMNQSGQSVQAAANYFNIPTAQVVIAHDELDLPSGVAKLKSHGGHGGHNGIRDIIRCLSTKEFRRIRIGIDHPGDREKVLGYVLQKPTAQQRTLIDDAIERCADVTELLASNQWELAINQVHVGNAGNTANTPNSY